MNLHEILSLVNKPGRYIGGEKNACNKRWDETRLRMCCIFPDLYEIGMSHQGLLILYDIINRQEALLADRCYCPDTDMEMLLKKSGLPIFGLETRKSLAEFDILAITLPYELCYVNIFTILALASIPFFSKERFSGRWPLILGGGSCCLNPEPVADLFDAIVIGDGEEVILEVARTVEECQQCKANKGQLLKRLSSIEGIYVPQFYKPVYEKHGAFKNIEVKCGAPNKVRRRLIPDLSPFHEIQTPLVPNIRIVHDRLGVEIARGCTRGCRYCQASTIYRPVREKSIEEIINTALRGIEKTGWEEISLLSLSTGDYSAIDELVPRVMDEFAQIHCSVSLPSLRIGTLTPEIMDQIKRVRKTGITLAPEAGSERLRLAINKGITEKDLLDTVRAAFERGWRNIKLYFMIGLPSETDKDIEELVKLVKKVKDQVKHVKNFKGSAQVTASIGTFVPKPQTPFQWEGQISIEESKRRIEAIKEGLKGKAFKVKWHDPRQSFLEGIFSRGDRRLSKLLHKAWSKGARLDAWTDHMKPELYNEAAKELGLDLPTFLLPIGKKAPLPWDHINSGVKKSFLLLENSRSQKGIYTPDCRYNDCQGCGVCDFKRIKNVLKGANTSKISKAYKESANPKNHSFFFLIEYRKLFDARFIGHLDMVRLFHRAARRAKIPVAYSKGFHPMPKIVFENPIPLGMESLRERLIIQLERNMEGLELKTRLMAQLTHGISLKKVTVIPKKKALIPLSIQSFVVMLSDIDKESVQETIRRLGSIDQLVICLKRKKGEVKVDLKKRLLSLELFKEETGEPEIKSWISLVKDQLSGKEKTIVKLVLDQSIPPLLKPAEVLAKLFELDSTRVAITRVLKL